MDFHSYKPHETSIQVGDFHLPYLITPPGTHG